MCEIKIEKKKKNEISSNEHPLIRDFRIFFFMENKKKEREKNQKQKVLISCFRFDSTRNTFFFDEIRFFPFPSPQLE